ncbi:MAG: sulfatase [Planctomycetota bacterium]
MIPDLSPMRFGGFLTAIPLPKVLDFDHYRGSAGNAFLCRVYWVLIFAVFLLFRASQLHADVKDAKPLNVIVFLVDDLGWSDVGYNGSSLYETPNIDSLAKRGAVFRNAYAASPLCSPTRAALLTGKSPARLWLTNAIGSPNRKPAEVKLETGQTLVTAISRDALDPGELTIAARLRAAGYATALNGKWHLGAQRNLPGHFGFTSNVAGNALAHPYRYFSPYLNELLPDGPRGEYLTDRLTNEAVDFIRSHVDQRFFLYLPHFAVHFPWEGKEELVAKYQKKVRDGAPQNNPVYAAMVESVDQSLGRILATLKETNLLDKTAIIFASDNGGVNIYYGGQYPRTATPPPRGTVITSNAPLRGGKGNLYEGGIRVPTIVYWPGVTRPGSVIDEPIVTMDFYPTILAMAGLTRQPGEAPEGINLEPLLARNETLGRGALYFHFPNGQRPASAIRKGKYKLIHYYSGKDELYDLETDLGERSNLVQAQPEKVKELREECLEYLRGIGGLFPSIR